MSNDVKRYSYGFHSDGFGEGRTLGLIEKEDGNLVRFEDYAALEAENARLAAQLSAIQGGMGDEPLVVATAILGGLFHGGSGPELGDIDVEVCTPHLEKIQCETVDSSDDVFMPLMTIAQHERIVAALKAQMAGQEPAGWQARFTSSGDERDEWSPCSKEHYELVKRCPTEWPGYEVREVFAAPPAAQDVSGLVEALHSMTCAYRSAIQAGYDRITALGGDCDSVQLMLNNYPDYRKAVALIAAHRQAQRQAG